MAENDVTRRDFLHTTTAGAAAIGLGGALLNDTSDAQVTGIPTRPLGNTGVRVSIVCLGGWHIGAAGKDSGDAEAIRIMHAAIDEGITFFDNAWDYHDGYAEELMGKALKSGNRREKVFLMTKNCERDYEGSMCDLDDSLRRLQTDRIDLWQFHEMVYDNDPDWVFDKGGMKAALEAQKAGKVRFIGFTGHKDPRIHLKMLDKPYAWASAQMPINPMDYHYRSFQNEVVPVCNRKGVGVIGMKGLGGGHPKAKIPMEGGVSAQDCRRYALSLPISSLVCGIISMDDLKQDIEVARGFTPMTQAERSALVARIKDDATDGRHELFKSSKVYDGPHHRKQHGFATDLNG